MRKLYWKGLLCILVLLAVLTPAVLYWGLIYPKRVFDPTITRELISAVETNSVPFAFTSQRGWRRLVYSAQFDLKSTNSDLFYELRITVTSGETMLTAEKYEESKKEVAELDQKEADPEARWSSFLFPDIGRRARVDFVMSPNGGGDSVTFTTTDGRFDVEVSQGNHMEDGMKSPSIDTIKLGKLIAEKYDLRHR